MSEWLGKPRIEEEDIRRSQPSLAKYFPILTKYFVDNQKMRVTVILPHGTDDKFREAVIRAYGSFTPTNVDKAASEALNYWIEKHL